MIYLGVQYAAVLKNIYALGAGIAHGLQYGDNFLSVYIANAADEMAAFLKKFGAEDIVVGEHGREEDPVTHRKTPNYAASVYLGDLLVTCYSLYSRNRTFGNMIGKGYSVKSAQLEMNMVAEGYNASKCIHYINQICAGIYSYSRNQSIKYFGKMLKQPKGLNELNRYGLKIKRSICHFLIRALGLQLY